ncbi:hypothetical protein Goshw_018385 [Gossypium schwendimanii]|uniref:Uncharacterized protein n=1 Tax=Gossypium schwendimanii TaxID=34291 RepID=A0A7J9KXY0_GOSSC|nr:hypothetical protein [Gossypium schwendimanii]
MAPPSPANKPPPSPTVAPPSPANKPPPSPTVAPPSPATKPPPSPTGTPPPSIKPPPSPIVPPPPRHHPFHPSPPPLFLHHHHLMKPLYQALMVHKTPVLLVEDDIRIDEEIKKNKKTSEGLLHSHLKSLQEISHSQACDGYGGTKAS